MKTTRYLSGQVSAGERSGRSRRTALAVVAAVCVLGNSGCHVARETAALPADMVTGVLRSPQGSQTDSALLQGKLLRFADDLFGLTGTGLDEYARMGQTAEAREQALTWKVALCSSALGIATGENQLASLVDFLGLTALTRAFVEKEAARAQPPGAMDVWLANALTLETNAWNLAGEILSEQHQEEYRAALTQWLKQNEVTSGGFFRRPQQPLAELRRSSQSVSQPGSVFSLVRLDPTAGLDPAVREVARTRLFAERSMFALERMPFLLRWQSELLVGQLLRQQEITNALASADRLSRSVESASQTAALLPEKVAAERKAILDALQDRDGKLNALSSEISRTLAAGERMSTSLNTTIGSFDLLMKRFGVGEPDPSPPDTNAIPFNILDYAHTAEQIANMAQQLDLLLKDTSSTIDTPALDKRIARLSSLSTQARADAKSVLNHAFALTAGLIALGFAGALLYRRLGQDRVVNTLVASREKERSNERISL